MSVQEYQILLSKYQELLKEQQNVCDMLINLNRETLDEIDGYCDFFKILKEAIENDNVDDLKERFK